MLIHQPNSPAAGIVNGLMLSTPLWFFGALAALGALYH